MACWLLTTTALWAVALAVMFYGAALTRPATWNGPNTVCYAAPVASVDMSWAHAVNLHLINAALVALLAVFILWSVKLGQARLAPRTVGRRPAFCGVHPTQRCPATRLD